MAVAVTVVVVVSVCVCMLCLMTSPPGDGVSILFRTLNIYRLLFTFLLQFYLPFVYTHAWEEEGGTSFSVLSPTTV